MNKSLLCLLVCAATLIGCGKSEDQASMDKLAGNMKTPEKAAAAIETTFTKSPEDAQAAKVAAQAIKTKDYEAAAAALTTLQQAPQARTFDEAQVINQAMRNLQGELIGAAAAGDPKAKKAIEALKRRGGR